MSDSPKADAWFQGGMQLRWGWDPGNSGNTESVASNLVSTNGAAYTTLSEVRALAARPVSGFYGVVQYNRVDYVYRPGIFRMIVSPDDYHFLASSPGYITVPHGTSPEIAWNLLAYIRQEAALLGGGHIDDLPPEPAAGVVLAPIEREPCPICAAEAAALAETSVVDTSAVR